VAEGEPLQVRKNRQERFLTSAFLADGPKGKIQDVFYNPAGPAIQ
jgi:hypothetical protein